MTQEEEELLLVDLCSRLPYGVKIQVEGLERDIIKDKGIRILASVLPLRNAVEYDNHGANYGVNIEQVKPYLRPMSSMTEEEREEEKKLWDIVIKTRNDLHYLYTDFLLSRHLDFRGLIPMGLALEATSDMYDIKI